MRARVCRIDVFDELVHIDFFSVVVANGLRDEIFFPEPVCKFVLDEFDDQVDEYAPQQEGNGDADHYQGKDVGGLYGG